MIWVALNLKSAVPHELRNMPEAYVYDAIGGMELTNSGQWNLGPWEAKTEATVPTLALGPVCSLYLRVLVGTREGLTWCQVTRTTLVSVSAASLRLQFTLLPPCRRHRSPYHAAVACGESNTGNINLSFPTINGPLLISVPPCNLSARFNISFEDIFICGEFIRLIFSWDKYVKILLTLPMF